MTLKEDIAKQRLMDKQKAQVMVMVMVMVEDRGLGIGDWSMVDGEW